MKLATNFQFTGDPVKMTRQIQDMESAGIDVVVTAEIYGFDMVSTLGYVAAKTERVELMTGIMPLYSRSAALIAQSAATLDALSGGRFILGLGTSGPQVIEGWHGVPYTKPIGTTRDVIEICRKVWARERVEHEGRYALIASKGGAPEHPDWYHNLVAEPTIMIQDGPEPFTTTCALVSGAERDEWFERGVAVFPTYAEYKVKADEADREIPVFVSAAAS